MARSVIVSFEGSNGVDTCVLIVGEKKPGEAIEIINAIQGVEAEKLWNELTVKKESKHD